MSTQSTGAAFPAQPPAFVPAISCAVAAVIARIVASTVLCGELSLLSALSSNHLISAHMALNRKPAQ